VPLWMGQQLLTRITRVAARGKRACIADGYERLEPVTVVAAEEAMTWTERRLVVRSRQQAHARETALHTRLAQAAVAALNERGRGTPRLIERPALQEAMAAILMRYRVQGLLVVRDTEYVQERRCGAMAAGQRRYE
jgi:hypothetical protein